MIKFECEQQEMIVHGDRNFSVYKDYSLPFIKEYNENLALIYQDFEVVIDENFLEGNVISKPQLLMVTVMMVN